MEQPCAMFNGINPPSTAFIHSEGSDFDFGELEEAILLQGVKIRNDQPKSRLGQGRDDGLEGAGKTLEMFPSWPMRFQHTCTPTILPEQQGSSRSGEESTDDSGSAVNTTTDQYHHHLHQHKLEHTESPIISSGKRAAPSSSCSDHLQHHQMEISAAAAGNEGVKPQPDDKRKVITPSEKSLEAKTLRRLAQNREAARKSRLRKKAYVQQLESSRVKLSQLEQELHRARQQGVFAGGNLSSAAAMFDAEYARWLEEDLRQMSELRSGLHAQLSESELRELVERYICHYDEIFRVKGETAKSDVFHLITGMWCTSAERCFLWMGGFRPSDLIKMLISQLDPLTEQQVMGIYSLQHSTQQAEEALTQGLEQLQHSLVDTIAAPADGMQQMAVALAKVSNLQSFLRQADNLRQQTIHQLRRILTVRQAARCFLVIGEYYGRLRALSSLWASRPREVMREEINSCQMISQDVQMVQLPPPQHTHFASF